jgi:hypothetical protein
LLTPANIRTLGGAIFGDYRYGQVFIYHNGVQSYYAARGFRENWRCKHNTKEQPDDVKQRVQLKIELSPASGFVRITKAQSGGNVKSMPDKPALNQHFQNATHRNGLPTLEYNMFLVAMPDSRCNLFRPSLVMKRIFTFSSFQVAKAGGLTQLHGAVCPFFDAVQHVIAGK